MKVIIAGSRHVEDIRTLRLAISMAKDRGIIVTEVVSGCAAGADRLGIVYAVAERLPVTKFPALWNQHGIEAGFIRNEAMACYGEALIAVWDGISRGTHDMIKRAKAHGLQVYIYRVLKPKTKRTMEERKDL